MVNFPASMRCADSRLNILELTFPQLEEWFMLDLNQPKFRAVQVWQWVWQKMIRNFDQMTNVSQTLRTILKDRASILWPEIKYKQISKDGTIKFLLCLEDGANIETVLIPAENKAGKIRWSQCLSTQVGCKMGCSFCATGQSGFKRNMSMGEILGQVLLAREYLNDYRLDTPILRNLVFMGMGEPLLNIQTLLPTLQTLGHDKGLNFSPRRITVSTCGIENGLKILGECGLAYLAISLHAPNQELRAKLMPKAAAWDLKQMFAFLKKYPLKTRERITFEYLLLGGINDRIEHAKELASLVKQVKGKVNLICYNSVPGLPYNPPTEKAIEDFQKYLCGHQITAILRKSKGADINAACGQLATNK